MAGKGQIKGITIEFAADSSELTKALKSADKAASEAQRSLREINKALKLDPNNVTLLKQKQVELKKAIDATTTELNGFKQELAAMDADDSTDKQSEKYLKLQRNIMQCEDQLKGYNAELRRTNAQASTLGQVGAKFSEIGNKCQSLGRSLTAVSAAAAGVVAALGGVAYSTAVWADDLNTLSKVTGISTDKLQLYSAAADLVDVSTETIAKSVARMKKNMLTAQGGTGAAAEAFEALGISVEDANGNLRDQDSVFQETIDALGKMENETERDALAMSIFGKSATELNPLIEDCGQTFRDVSKMMSENGLEPLDQKTIDKANEFNDSVDRMKLNLNQARIILGAKLGESFGKNIEKISKKIGDIAGKIANMNPKLLKIITIVAGVVAILAPALIVIGAVASGVGAIITAVSALGPVLTGLMTIIKGIGVAIAANPIGAIITGVALLVVGLVKLYKSSAEFRKMVDSLVTKIKGLGKAIATFTKTAITKLRNGFAQVKSIGKNIVAGLWNGISDKFSWLVGKIKSFTNNVKNKLKAFFGIKSPSRWARDVIGSNIAKGIGVGFDSTMSAVTNNMRSTINSSKSTLAAQRSSIGDEVSSAVGTGLALANSGPNEFKGTIVVNLGGAKVAEQIFKLNKQGAMALQG